ncbi:MAG: hypothetical protein LN413_02075 [Candidatus Thermoplasmatota archaeon]|nr:hypothetical protein [Candidatus Thermoplasmatota archaeon]
MELQASPQESGVGAVDRYIGRVARHLVGLSGKHRQDVLLELRSNIMAEAEGGDISSVVERLAPARETAHSYIDLYGYGVLPKALAFLVAAGIAFLTLPFALVPSSILGTTWLSNLSLVLLLLFLIGVGLKLGRPVALAAGLGVAAIRLGGLVAALAASVPDVAQPAALLAFVLTTLALAFAGFLAAPRRPRPEAG